MVPSYPQRASLSWRVVVWVAAEGGGVVCGCSASRERWGKGGGEATPLRHVMWDPNGPDTYVGVALLKDAK